VHLGKEDNNPAAIKHTHRGGDERQRTNTHVSTTFLLERDWIGVEAKIQEPVDEVHVQGYEDENWLKCEEDNWPEKVVVRNHLYVDGFLFALGI